MDQIIRHIKFNFLPGQTIETDNNDGTYNIEYVTHVFRDCIHTLRMEESLMVQLPVEDFICPETMHPLHPAQYKNRFAGKLPKFVYFTNQMQYILRNKNNKSCKYWRGAYSQRKLNWSYSTKFLTLN